MQSPNFHKAQPPIFFLASDVKLMSNFPNSRDKLWSANITASRHGKESNEFSEILFVESPLGEGKLVYVYGIEFDDDYPKGLRQELAAKQQAFIKFLRVENAKDDEVLGWMTALFSGSQYACIVKATKAFTSAFDSQAYIGVSYHDQHGQHRLEALKPEITE